MNRVFLVSASRTAIGSFAGTLGQVAPAELGRVAAAETLKRAGLSEDTLSSGVVDEVIVGNVLGAGHGMNIARQVTLKSKLPVITPAYTVNKVCGSGLKAITLAATEIGAGNAELILAGGVESMSQAPFVSLTARTGARLGHTELRDLILQDGLTDVFHGCHMGITAENLASRYEISRQAQDEFAFCSQQKAGAAIENGYFKDEIVGYPITDRKGVQTGMFAQDEFVRAKTTLESLAGLKPAFKKDGTVTAGNASGINDGAAMVLCASEGALKKFGLKPMAEILGFASSGVEPEIMGIGPVEAVKKLCTKTGIALSGVDLIEANEAFAVQSLAVSKLLGWDSAKVNVCGGAIALGHPIGASGARIVVTLLHQLKRIGGKIGLATLCVGGGQGIALMIKSS